MILIRTAPGGNVVRTSGSVGESSKVVIERMVLHHHDDDVVDFVQTTRWRRSLCSRTRRTTGARGGQKNHGQLHVSQRQLHGCSLEIYTEVFRWRLEPPNTLAPTASSAHSL